VRGRVVFGLVPDPGVGLAGEPLVVLSAQADDGGTLRGREVVSGDADGPAEAGRLRDDLAGRVLLPGRRMRSIACISSTVAKSFIPIGVTRMRSSSFSSSTSAGQSYSFGSSTAISSMLMTLIAYPSCFRLVHAEARG